MFNVFNMYLISSNPKFNLQKNKLNELLCSVGSAITAIKAAKEGPRQIIIIASKGEKIHLRDASSGLLLRAISVLENHNISNIVLSGGLLYCGSNANKVFVYDFTVIPLQFYIHLFHNYI